MAGQDFVPGWTMDHTSPKFLDSLKLMCTKGTSEYMAFMTKAGMCMTRCTNDPQELFINEFAGACGWYSAHKDDVCGAEPATPPAATTTSASTLPIPTPPASGTTYVPIHTGAPVVPSPSNNGTAPDAKTSDAAGTNTSKDTQNPNATDANASKDAQNPNAAGSNTSKDAQNPNAAGANASKDTQNPNAANKLPIGGFALAMIASAGYLAL
jgi:hypothetical protein